MPFTITLGNISFRRCSVKYWSSPRLRVATPHTPTTRLRLAAVMAGGGGVMRKLDRLTVQMLSSLIFSFSFELMMDRRTVSAVIYASARPLTLTGRYSF